MVGDDWSAERQIEFYELTRQLLDHHREIAVVDAITVVHGYEQLAAQCPNDVSFWTNLREGLIHLATIIETKGKNIEAARLRLLAPME